MILNSRLGGSSPIPIPRELQTSLGVIGNGVLQKIPRLLRTNRPADLSATEPVLARVARRLEKQRTAVRHSRTYLLRKRMVSTYISGLMSLRRGEKKFRMVQEMTPAQMPSEML